MQINLTIAGKWRDPDKLLEGATATGHALSRVIALSPEDAYNRVFGDLTFRPSFSLKYFGYAEKDRVTFKPGKITPRLVVHELGHVFALRNACPMDFLTKKGIYTPSGKFLTGTHPYGYYHRNNGKRAPDNGYHSDWYTDGYQLHPVTMPGGNCASEDWADLFLNWVYNSFVGNEAGRTLHAWVDEHMTLWLSDDSPKSKEQKGSLP